MKAYHAIELVANAFSRKVVLAPFFAPDFMTHYGSLSDIRGDNETSDARGQNICRPALKTGKSANPMRFSHLQAAYRLVHGFSTALRPPFVQNRRKAAISLWFR